MTSNLTIVLLVAWLAWALRSRSRLALEVARWTEQAQQTSAALGRARAELACEAERRHAASAAQHAVERRARRQAAIAILGQRALAGARGVALASHAVDVVTRTLGPSTCEVLERSASGSWRTVATGPSGPHPVGSLRSLGPRAFLAQPLQTPWPVVSRDLRTDDRYEREESADPDVRAALSVAIPTPGVAVDGLLFVTSSRPDAFDDEDGQFLQAIALVMATARSRTLVRGRGEVLGSFTQAAAHGLGVSRASVWLFDPERTKIVCADLFNRDTRVHEEGAELLASQFPAYFAALVSEGTVSAPDAQVDLRTAEFTASYLRPLGITAMLDVPIWVDDEMVGVLCHEHIGGPRAWSREDEELAYLMGSLVARAIERRGRPRLIAA